MKTFSLRVLRAAAISFALISFGTLCAFAQPVPDAAPIYTAEQLEKLVGPIALYPDDLLAITLPSATYPLDLVKGQRFLDKRKTDPKAEPDKSLPDSVLKLLNYPDVVKMMNDNLDWTEALGEAVDTNEAGVMDAIQAFRRKAEGAGNLKSNDKQVVTVQNEIIEIMPADPEVIYVPQYQPASVIAYSTTPYAWGYYPTPYPSYYYPYAPGAALGAGLILGAAIGGAWGMGWNNGRVEHHINVDRNTNINVGNRPNAGNRPAQGGGGQNWRNDRAPTQTRAGAQARQGNVGSRPGDARVGGGASGRPSYTGAASSRASASNYSGARPSGSAGSMQNRSGNFSGGSAFSGAGSSGTSANRASARGASSMSSSSARAASRPSGGGGGARGGGGRGGGGGGGRGGGGRR